MTPSNPRDSINPQGQPWLEAIPGLRPSPWPPVGSGLGWADPEG
ncbi:MAG: hypothetical protein ACOYW9_00260 [Deinococcota bacterium]